MIEQLQSFMKALEAGSYNAAPQLHVAPDCGYRERYIWCPNTNSEKVILEPVIVDNGTAFQRNCDCPEVDERGIGKHGRMIKKEREPNDPYRYYFGDHTWEYHK